jgi:folate-binding protein YgfZ
MILETPLRSEHQKLGARLAPYFDCHLPERFTDTPTECRLARDSAVLLDTNYQAIFEFTGPDRVRYLNAILSNNIKDLAVGQGTVALLLNPQGHILAELGCYVLPDKLLVISHARVRERTVQTLNKYIIMDDVTLEDATLRIATLAVEGPRTPELLQEVAGISLATLAEYGHSAANIGEMSCRVVRRSHFGEAGAEILVESANIERLWNVLLQAVRGKGGAPIGYAAFDVLRLDVGVPWFGYDFDDNVIPHEAGLENSHISYTKGCYIGQEIVERVRSRGHGNRRRVSLLFTGAGVPEAGTRLLADGKEAGHVTSAVLSPIRNRGIGMGYLRPEYAVAGSAVAWSKGTAEVFDPPLRRASAPSSLTTH